MALFLEVWTSAFTMVEGSEARFPLTLRGAQGQDPGPWVLVLLDSTSEVQFTELSGTCPAATESQALLRLSLLPRKWAVPSHGHLLQIRRTFTSVSWVPFLVQAVETSLSRAAMAPGCSWGSLTSPGHQPCPAVGTCWNPASPAPSIWSWAPGYHLTGPPWGQLQVLLSGISSSTGKVARRLWPSLPPCPVPASSLHRSVSIRGCSRETERRLGRHSPPSPCSRQQNSAKARSVWEQRASQLRLQNLRASCEALYSEMDPEERLRYATTRHLRPDMKTHLDRPLVVEPGRDAPRAPSAAKARLEGGEAPESADPPRRHHRHRDKDKTVAPLTGEQDRADAPRAESGEPGLREERARPRRSRSKEAPGTQEVRVERSRGPCPEGGRRHHRRGSPEEAEREPRRHRAHRYVPEQCKDGKGERRARHRAGPRAGPREAESGEEPVRRHRARHKALPAPEPPEKEAPEKETGDAEKEIRNHQPK